MTEHQQLTVAQKQKQQRKNRILTLFITAAVIITFFLGYGVGQITGGKGSEDLPAISGKFSTFESVYNILSKKFYFGDDTNEYRQKLVEQAIKGMVDAQGDIHSEYMTADELASFSSSLESSFVGIGVRYNMLSGNVFVISVISGSPAEAAGIMAGDFIIAVDGVPCETIDPDDIPSHITGIAGTQVHLTLLRDNQQIEMDVTRAQIDKTVSSEIKDGIGIVEISSFATGTAVELKKHLERFDQAGVTRIIIDLRSNGGGYASTLDDMCRYFLDQGDIVMIEEDRYGKEIVDKVSHSEKFDYDRIVILTDGNTASCSEVFTMALKEQADAVTVGETTYGKGIAQMTKVFSDGSALKYTDLIWKSGNGVSIHKTGIEPDYTVRLHEALYQSYIVMEEGESYKYDTVSSKVQVAQLILDFLGYKVDRTDGYFSSATTKAMKQFQQDNGLEATGIMDEATANTLTSCMIFEWNTKKDIHDTQMQKAMEIVRK